MREYGVTTCSPECGKTRFDDGWMVQCYKSAISFGVEFHCPHCGTRVGETLKGPWREAREAMVPRAALEWLAGKRGWMGCPGEWDCEAWCDERCGSSDEEVAACWVRSALKAAKEAKASE